MDIPEPPSRVPTLFAQNENGIGEDIRRVVFRHILAIRCRQIIGGQRLRRIMERALVHFEVAQHFGWRLHDPRLLPTEEGARVERDERTDAMDHRG